ncbi:MAG TPA: PAS domain-containing protein [Thermotogaceae bacterium]|nr:PAS domain-containing protein [Thermotogota bacterium]HEW91129.1 PAS domain-containing protein [Thermotogaceae bacterium]
METESDILKLFWQYDPNGLVIVDKDMRIRNLNPAFEKMFQITRENAIGFDLRKLIGEQGVEIFEEVFRTGKVNSVEKISFQSYGIIAKLIAFKIPESEMATGIFVDITLEEMKKNELTKIKLETLDRIKNVVLKQMKVAQEIASLLGETTAQTKASLLNLLNIIQGGK